MTTEFKMSIKLYDPSIVNGKRIAIAGRLGGMTRKDFRELLINNGAQLVDPGDLQVDLIVRGAESATHASDLEARRTAAIATTADDAAPVQVMDETGLWEALGFVEPETEIGRLYTPAMLADLLRVPVSTIRRWCRRGLIHPVRQFKKLPYFDFEEIASARRIARLIADGKSPASVEAKLAKIAKQYRGQDRASRTFSQLSVIVQGKHLLLRQGDGLIEPGGQKVFDFDGDEDHDSERVATKAGEASVILLDPYLDRKEESRPDDALNVDVHFENERFKNDLEDEFRLSPDAESIYSFPKTGDPDELIEMAIDFEDEGDLQSSIEVYRALALNCGGRADVSFRLAELLYQNGELSAARERYFSAIEMDPNFVEARASLGCVLVELGETELAISAFHGALEQHPDYPDVHYHLAKLLDEMGKPDDAQEYWQAFLDLAPKSPWADEARSALVKQ